MLKIEKFNLQAAALNTFKGFLIGAGAIAPGISGSSLAVSFGVYRQIIDIIAGIPKTIFRNFFFLMFLFIGAVSGLYIIAFLSELAINAGFGIPLYFIFGGLLIGTVPRQTIEAGSHGHKWPYLLIALAAFTLAATLGLIATNAEAATKITDNFFLLMLYGAILGLGIVVPGMSGATILIMIGVYELLMNAVSNLEIMTLIPVGLGGVLAIVLLAKLVRGVYKQYPGYFDYLVLGFIVGSIPVIYIMTWKQEGVDLSELRGIIILSIGIIMSLLSILFIFWFDRFDQRIKAQQAASEAATPEQSE